MKFLRFKVSEERIKALLLNEWRLDFLKMKARDIEIGSLYTRHDFLLRMRLIEQDRHKNQDDYLKHSMRCAGRLDSVCVPIELSHSELTELEKQEALIERCFKDMYSEYPVFLQAFPLESLDREKLEGGGK